MTQADINTISMLAATIVVFVGGAVSIGILWAGFYWMMKKVNNK